MNILPKEKKSNHRHQILYSSSTQYWNDKKILNAGTEGCILHLYFDTRIWKSKFWVGIGAQKWLG